MKGMIILLNLNETDISKLEPWGNNPRINDHAVDQVARSIESFGFNVPIICDQNHTIIAGHTRWKAAKKLSMKTVPVITIEMTDAMRRAFSIADNKTAELADWDFVKLREILGTLKNEDIDLTTIGFSDNELRRLLGLSKYDENEIYGC